MATPQASVPLPAEEIVLQRFISLGLLGALTLAFPRAARACDLCGCYTPQLETLSPLQAEAARSWTSGVYGAVAEQFTHFGTLQFEGDEVPNPTDQHLDSSITQLVGAYTFNSRFALQVNIPLIYRSFERPEGFAIDRGTESGLGDISLLGKFVLFHVEKGGGRTVNFDDPKSPRIEIVGPDFTCSGVLIGGVKFPTGDSSRLKEEFNEIEIEGAPESGIHGHDLTLGTGSYDGIFGGQFALRYKNFFFEQDLQFTLRGDGLHQYHFANDLSWSGGPGYYFVRTPQAIVGLQGIISGEYKDVDRFQGKVAEDTGITSIFAGPRLRASLGRISAEVAVEIPLSIDNSALQAVPDYRISAAFALRF
ncbi:MAG TPA: hypothetical protein VH207_09525 [Chthoniobacterales bacterium]|jgi:hypothetical protein|nr:hypothetical protein [Chthoniobacterales bacterium]